MTTTSSSAFDGRSIVDHLLVLDEIEFDPERVVWEPRVPEL